MCRRALCKSHYERHKGEYMARNYARYRADPKCRVTTRVRTYICKKLNGSKNWRHWQDLTGWDVDMLMSHLSGQLVHPMTWENYGSVWHIDHIIPLAAFNYTRPEDMDFKKAWSLSNLRPLLAKDNLSKGSRLARQHQPSLRLSA